MENIINHSEIKPVAEQIKTHIGNVDEEILTFCQKNGLQLMGYSPIATGQLIKDHRLVDMANKYQVTVPQLCIKYLVQRDILPLPKSTHKEFMEHNKQLDFTINAADMQILIDFVKGGFELSFYGGLKMYDSGGLRIDRCQTV